MLFAQSCDNCGNRDCTIDCNDVTNIPGQNIYTFCREYSTLVLKPTLTINDGLSCQNFTQSWEYTFDPDNNACGIVNTGGSYDSNTGAITNFIPTIKYQVCVTLDFSAAPNCTLDMVCFGLVGSIATDCSFNSSVGDINCPCAYPSTFDNQPNNILESCCFDNQFVNVCAGANSGFNRVWFFDRDTDMFFAIMPGTCEPILEFPAPSCVNSVTGETHQISNVCGMASDAFDDDILWCIEDRPDPLTDLLFAIDLSSGMITVGCHPVVGTCNTIYDIAIDNISGAIYAVGGGDNCDNTLLIIDMLSGNSFAIGNLLQNGTQFNGIIDYFTFDVDGESIMQLENDETFNINLSTGEVTQTFCPVFISCCNNCLNADCTHEQMTESEWGNGLSTGGIENFDMGADEDCNFFLSNQNDNVLTVCTEFIATGAEQQLAVGSSGEDCSSPTYTYELTQDAVGTGNACGVINTGVYNSTSGLITTFLEAGTTYQYCVTVDYSSEPTCNIDVICPVIISCDDAPDCCQANAGEFPANPPGNN